MLMSAEFVQQVLPWIIALIGALLGVASVLILRQYDLKCKRPCTSTAATVSMSFFVGVLFFGIFGAIGGGECLTRTMKIDKQTLMFLESEFKDFPDGAIVWKAEYQDWDSYSYAQETLSDYKTMDLPHGMSPRMKRIGIGCEFIRPEGFEATKAEIQAKCALFSGSRAEYFDPIIVKAYKAHQAQVESLYNPEDESQQAKFRTWLAPEIKKCLPWWLMLDEKSLRFYLE